MIAPRPALAVLAVAVLGLAAACGGGSAPATSTVAPPDEARPSAEGSAAHSIPTSGGGSLSAHVFAADPSRVAILMHMYAADQSAWYDAARQLGGGGVSVVTFDFSGFGESAGEQDPATMETDVQAVIAFAQASGYEEIVLIGASMGGTAAITVAGAVDGPPEGVDGVIAFSAPIEFGDLDATGPATALRVPMLLVAAEGDTSALDSLGLIAEAARVPDGRRVVVAGAAHGTELLDSEAAAEIWLQVSGFLEVIWPGTAVPLALEGPPGATR